jgi:predicted transcriptional regulator
MPHIHVKTRVRTAAQRLKAVEMNRQGVSNEAIAVELGVSTRMVINYLHQYLLTDARYPLNITPEVVAQMRSQHREHVEDNLRCLIQQREKLRALQPETAEGQCKVSDSLCRINDSSIRAFDHLSSVFGLFAPEERNNPGTVNNTQINMGESEFLRHLCNVKGIRLANE